MGFDDPTTGRYVTPDPIGLVGGINLFLYVAGNPVNRVDPSGKLDPRILQNAGAGVPVVLPNGYQIPNGGFGTTNYVMSPVSDLSDVAAAGRNTAVRIELCWTIQILPSAHCFTWPTNFAMILVRLVLLTTREVIAQGHTHNIDNSGMSPTSMLGYIVNK